MKRFRLPSLVEMIEKRGSRQDHQKDAPHVVEGVNPQIFDIQARFLVKAIGMFNVRAIAPSDKNGLGIIEGYERAIGE